MHISLGVYRSCLACCSAFLHDLSQLRFYHQRNRAPAHAAYRLGKKVMHIPGVGVDFTRLDRGDGQDGERLRAEWGIPRSAFVLFYAAEFFRRKSQSVLIHAMEELPENVVLAGEGTLLRECQEQVQSLGAGRVIFPGYVQNPGPWYRAADAAVSASRIEGLPFNVMEAMYCGLPVVASTVKGNIDLIRDGETGLLYPYGNTDTCAGQIMQLANSAQLRADLGTRAHKEVLQYGLNEVFPVVAGAYAALLPPVMGRTRTLLPQQGTLSAYRNPYKTHTGTKKGHTAAYFKEQKAAQRKYRKPLWHNDSRHQSKTGNNRRK